MESAIEALNKHLDSSDERVLVEATKLCVGQTFPAIIPKLIKLTSHPNLEVSYNATISLTYMTTEQPDSMTQMISGGAVKRLLDSVISADPTNVDYKLQLLTNLTTKSLGAMELLDIKDPELKGQRLLRLAIRFANPPDETIIPQTEMLRGLPIAASTTTNDEYQYAAMVLMNATLIKDGREIFYQNPKFFMPSLLECMSSNNPIRKEGVIGIIRNLCFEQSKHEFLLKEVNILPHIIRPLVPTSLQYNITAYEMLQQVFPGVSFPGMEPLATNRKLLLETILLLTQSEVGKNELIRHHVVFAMREVEANETDEENKELTYRIGAVLLPPEDLPSKEECEKLMKEINEDID
jgi:hypothetical protein